MDRYQQTKVRAEHNEGIGILFGTNFALPNECPSSHSDAEVAENFMKTKIQKHMQPYEQNRSVALSARSSLTQIIELWDRKVVGHSNLAQHEAPFRRMHSHLTCQLREDQVVRPRWLQRVHHRHRAERRLRWNHVARTRGLIILLLDERIQTLR